MSKPAPPPFPWPLVVAFLAAMLLVVVVSTYACQSQDEEEHSGEAALCDFVCVSDYETGDNKCEWVCETPELQVDCEVCDYLCHRGECSFICGGCNVAVYSD